MIDTKMNATLATNLRTPKDPGFTTGSGTEFIPDPEDRIYPFVGNGFTASRDGRLTPEWSTAPTQMSPDLTTIAFKNADGTPRVIDLGQAGSGDRWVLRLIDPDDPGAGNVWEPLP